jgi:hypothetical protein
MTTSMPAKPVRIGVWEALLPFAFTLVQAGTVVAVLVGLIPWPVGLGLWILMLVAFVAFSWIRSARLKASLQPGEWLAVEEQRGFPATARSVCSLSAQCSHC